MKSLLEGLDLLSNEAVFFRNKEDGQTFTAFPSEIKKKINIIQPDAFFIFNNQPYILFFDLTNTKELEREQEIYKQVWSFDYSPLIFFVKDNEIQIFNAFSYDKKNNRLQEIELSEKDRNEIFSFWKLQSGESWRWLQDTQYKNAIQKKRVNQRLFENIKEVREKLTNEKNDNYLSEDEANILILRLIFIRYLIDRDVKIDESYIKGNSIIERRKSFGKLIGEPTKLNNFFAELNRKFNGVLFKDVDIQLSDFQAQSLSLIFNGKDNPNVPSLFDELDFYFEIFDFSIIPVEVISGIYESLISPETRNEHSAIYTPSFLVEYILTQTVDKYLDKHQTSECTVFDPSCGSGIFLVQSYRRMVDKEKILFGERVSKIRLREIAQNNLFGIDLNEQALKVTSFSIYIAILDYQDPKTILDSFKFPKLISENLFAANFFDTSHSYNGIIKSKELDFILGNPPWKKDKSEFHLNWLNRNNIYRKQIKGEIEIAQSFLLHSKDFMQLNTVSALIVTSTSFYNISTITKEFKKIFLTRFSLDIFFDLSPVRRLIFEEKSSPASIVFYRLSNEEDCVINVVKHLSVKSNIFLKYYKTLIIEKFDQKEIQQKHFIENEWMFKVALYGNTLDFAFLKRLEQNKRNASNFINNNMGERGLGVIKISDKSKTTPKYYPNLIGYAKIENQEIKRYYTAIENQEKLGAKDVYFIRGRKEELFRGSKILLKEQCFDETFIGVSFSDKDCVYVNGVSGITFNNEEKTKLLYAYLISDIVTYYLYLKSCSWGVATRPAVRFKDEFLSFPFAEVISLVEAKLISLVEQFLEPFKSHYSQILRSASSPIFHLILEEINSIINSTYQINEYEKDLIDYTLNVSRYQFQESKQHKFLRKVDNDLDFLQKYASVFLKEFKSLYEDENLQVEVFPLNHFIAMNFIFSKEELASKEKVVVIHHNTDEKEILKRIASNLTISKVTNSKDPKKNLYIQKDIKGFEENSFYIIKPNEYKCWHRAMAWYDVAEIKEAIEKAELNHLKETIDVS